MTELGPILSVNQLLGIFLTILLAMVGFFLVMFYHKVDQIGKDVSTMQINGAARDEQIKAIEKRLSQIEKIISINS